ncbi:MAG: DUF4846 domain-containing protein [Hyphomicrobium sp.]
MAGREHCGVEKVLARREFLRRATLALMLPAAASPLGAAGLYAWTEPTPAAVEVAADGTLSSRFNPPPGFQRVAAPDKSFAAWLRGLPMKPAAASVVLYDGREKARQDVHAGVIAIDVGTKDLQQCADAVMRLRAEWLFATGRAGDIAFNVTEGGRVPFSRWAKGERPAPSGKTWKKSAAADSSYASFRKYLNFVFAYAGTASLEKELVAVDDGQIEIGNVFIKGGFPGHAVLVADMAENAVTKARRFLLLQSFMPAQEMHVLKNPANGDGSPWYARPEGDLVTPEWTFPKGSLKRWPEPAKG